MSPAGSDPLTACHVVAVPYPGRGHINPMMNLCKLLTSSNPHLLVTFVITEEWLGFIGSEEKPPSIRFATIPNVLPSELARAVDMTSFVEATQTKMEEPFERLLDRLDAPVNIIIADTFLNWAVDVGNRRNIPVASLWPMPASVFSIFYHFHLLADNGHFPFELSAKSHSTNQNDDRHYFEWLNSKPPSSVLYVSLGSFLSVSSAQMDENAKGLRDSGVTFLWVARGESTKLQEKCGDGGKVVAWCDQLKVLCHSSVGGFWTHCGWSSTLEGMYAGVPMITLPILADQTTTSKFIVEDWKIGWDGKRGVKGGDFLRSAHISEMVRRFMDLESIERKEMTRRARELQVVAGGAILDGGSSKMNLDSFLDDITRF
ncbi:UNVERIFIED_CONTAM: UDP-glycosyltransferase 87A2 [Sesamum radiatum]|uniref:UDP-glycosyltransferase 87A2 n=1 Tax=Sesamum radiatum TaxID=300843 RepID=A0AAW2W3K1_SESRA